MEKIEIVGYWNLPGDESNSYSGNLLVEDGKIKLTLLGCYDLPGGTFTVHGLSTSGKKITLYKCFTTKRSMSVPGIPYAEVTSNYFIKGEHLTDDSLTFSNALLDFSGLSEWIDIGGFTDFENREELSIKYKTPEAITFYKTENIEFAFVFQSSSPIFRPTHSYTISQQTVIQIKHKNEFNLDEFWEYVSIIKSFLTLAYFSEPILQELKFKKENKILEVIYAGQKTDFKKLKVNKRDFLFTYKNVKNQLQTIFSKWATLNKVLDPVVNILLEAFGTRNIINENKFLNIIQGIETFHRRVKKNEMEKDIFHKKRVSEIIALCPLEYRPWLQEKLNFSNEPTLKQRIEELFETMDPLLKNHLFNDYESIISNAKNSRNYYTHYSPKLEKKALKDTQLFYLTERLKIFLLILLLSETGIEKENLSNIIKESSQFLFNHLITA